MEIYFRETENTKYTALKLERYSLKVAMAYENGKRMSW